MLLDAKRSALLVVDIQERLAAAIPDAAAIIERTKILLAAAIRLDVPIVFSEQYPKGLGSTDARLQPVPNSAVVLPKLDFSCAADPGLKAAIAATGRDQIVLCGMETHVCVLQSALGFIAEERRVFVVADAVGSRHEERRRLGLERMRSAGAEIVDSEMVVFEWLGAAGTDAFRELSRLIR